MVPSSLEVGLCDQPHNAAICGLLKLNSCPEPVVAFGEYFRSRERDVTLGISCGTKHSQLDAVDTLQRLSWVHPDWMGSWKYPISIRSNRMRFYTQAHRCDCGSDLHARWMYPCIHIGEAFRSAGAFC